MNIKHTPPFASRVATTPIPVTLWLGSRVVGLKYWRIPVLVLKKKQNRKMELILPPSLLLYYTRPQIFHYCHFSWNCQLSFICSTSMCTLTIPTKSHAHKFNYCDLFFGMLSALAKLAQVKSMQTL